MTLNWIIPAIAAVVFLGGVVVYLRGSSDQGTIKTLKDSNLALAERVDILERSEKLLKAEAEAERVKHAAVVKALSVRLDAVEKENLRLQTQRPSAEAIEALHADLRRHDAQPGCLKQGEQDDDH